VSASAVAGPSMLSSSAAELLGQAAADPSAPLCAGIGAPGGYGKTTLLHELSELYHHAGMPVATPWRPAGPLGEQMLLVDDAHLLDETRLDELRNYAERPDARIVVAYRPWPRPAALLRMVDVLRRTRPPVVLPGLTNDQIRARLAATLPSPPPAELVGFVAAQSGRVLRYVVRMATALSAAAAATPPHIPVGALAPFAADLDELDPDLRTLLLAVEAGAGLSFDLIAALLERDADTVTDLVDAGRAAGLLAADGTLVPLARHAIAALGPIGQRIDVRQRLAALQLARGGPVLPLVRPLLRVADGDAADPAGVHLVPGAAGDGLGLMYETAGEEALGNDPALAARLFAAAAGAGRTTAARRALATALAGDLDLAAQLADQSLAAGPPSQRSGAAFVAAVVLAHRGQLAQAVELYQWSQSSAAAGFGVIGLIGTGRLADAQRLTGSAQPPGGAAAEPPTSLSVAASLMARGMAESVTGSPAAALSTLVQASVLIEPAGAAVLLPDSPTALGAMLAVHGAELDTADALLTRAIQSGMGGALLAPRHRLLQAWVSMLRGRVAAAEQGLAGGLSATGDDAVLHGRDLLFGAALRVALARRNSDLVGLRTTWPDACQVLIGSPVDLFALLPLGEMTVAAARLGEEHRVAEHLAEADRLLERLGDPPLWSLPLHWSRLHAAILAEDAASAEQHASALDRQRGFSPYAAAVAAAAQAWLDVLADRAEPESVVDAARGLAALGLTWDGTRLAGQAAIRTPDRKAMTVLLDCARVLQGRPVESRDTTPAGTGPRGRAGDGQLLSGREHEVVTLVLAGLTYKQVADRLFISAKTVEHHMARIRQRLGCTDRRELLARLRAMTDESAKPGTGGRP
jgi:DNA-binding CsgD family transcriptional regulator